MNREFRNKLRNLRKVMYEVMGELEVIVQQFDNDGEIEISEEEEIPVNWTTADEDKEGPYLKDLNELTTLKGLAITGQIKAVSDLKTYKKKDGSIGLIYNVLLSDPTGDMLCVFWDEQVEDAKKFTIGQYIRITNAWKVQENKMGKLELHPGKFAQIEAVE